VTGDNATEGKRRKCKATEGNRRNRRQQKATEGNRREQEATEVEIQTGTQSRAYCTNKSKRSRTRSALDTTQWDCRWQCVLVTRACAVGDCRHCTQRVCHARNLVGGLAMLRVSSLAQRHENVFK
jgi:hypothetical protein